MSTHNYVQLGDRLVDLHMFPIIRLDYFDSQPGAQIVFTTATGRTMRIDYRSDRAAASHFAIIQEALMPSSTTTN